MKRITLIGLAFILLASFSYAQTGGMMGGQEGTEGTKGHTQKMKEGKGMMTPEQTQKEMKEMTDQMSEMMQKMAGKMKDMKTEEMKTVSKMMQDMSKQMQDMSMAMGKGWGKIHDMEKMKEQMKQMQKRIDAMEGEK